MWRGGVFHLHSRHDAPKEHDLHSHFLTQLTVGLHEIVSLRSGRDEPERFASGWLIGSGQAHLIECRGATIVILVDPFPQLDNAFAPGCKEWPRRLYPKGNAKLFS